MSGAIVRRFRADEWRVYRDLRLGALAESPDAFGSTLAHEDGRPEAHWRERLAAGVASVGDCPVVAIQRRAPVGLAWGRFDEDDDEGIHVFQMWVAPEARQGGIGRALLDAVVSWAARTERGWLELEVACDNGPARRLYERAGFVARGGPGALREGSDLRSQVMRLDLQSVRPATTAERYAPFPEAFPELRGEGLLLRALSEVDLPRWVERLSDTAAASLAGDPIEDPDRVAAEGLAHHRAAFRTCTGLRWAIVPEGEPAAVGSIGFVGLDPVARAAEVGVAIGRRHWRRGLATRAGRLVLGYGFGPLALRRVEAVVLPENAGSLALLDHFGFAEAPCPEDRAVNGRADSRLFTLGRDAWLD